MIINFELLQVFNLSSYLDSTSATVHLPFSALRILILSLSLKDFTAFNSFLIISGMEDLRFCNMDLISHLNPMSSVCGSFETTYSRPHAVECRFVTEKFKPYRSQGIHWIRCWMNTSLVVVKIKILCLEAEFHILTLIHQKSQVSKSQIPDNITCVGL
jgi:hypothetical protein